MSERKRFDQNEDLMSMKLLECFIPNDQYFPYTSSSLSFQSIRIIVNDIILNGRHNIIEFGSGLSTLVFKNVLESVKTNDAKLISIDENEEWVQLLNSFVNEGTIIHAPLSEEANSWYMLQGNLVPRIKFNVVVVDGPSAWQKDRVLAREGALEFILTNQLLADEFSIYLDDCNREGEKKIIQKWAERLGLKYSLVTESLGRISKGSKFNTL
jgi:hypothetical protein